MMTSEATKIAEGTLAAVVAYLRSTGMGEADVRRVVDTALRMTARAPTTSPARFVATTDELTQVLVSTRGGHAMPLWLELEADAVTIAETLVHGHADYVGASVYQAASRGGRCLMAVAE